MEDQIEKRGRGRPASPRAERPQPLDPAAAHPASAKIPAWLRLTTVERGVGMVGWCLVRTSDPTYASKALEACLSERSEWTLSEVLMGEDGSEVGWVFAAPASLIAPKAHKPRPDSSARLAKANEARRAKGKAAPLPKPADAGGGFDF